MENGNQFRNRRPNAANQPWDQGYEDNRYRQQGNERGPASRGDYNRVNYIPDNDANRDFRDRDYEDNFLGTSGTYGYGNHGAYSSDHGYQGGNESDRYGNTSYGKQYYAERERMRQQRNRETGNLYGNDYGRRDYGRSQLGHNFGSSGSSYQNQGYGSSADNYRSDYNNDNRNRYSGSGNNPGFTPQGRDDDDRGWWDRTRDEVSSWFGDDDAERRRNMDSPYEGGHRGKGPRDYQRSQDRIREDVCDRLSDDDRVDASDIQVEVQGNDVILRGTVHSKAEKRRAEDLVESISGVKHVENRIKINRDDERTTDSWSSSIGL